MQDLFDRLETALADRYGIERELGAGGMATVYLAEDLKHHRTVAVKVFRPELAAILGADRFLNEIQVTANLQHPNILPLYDSGQADTFLYFAMPYVEGGTLRDKLDREKQLSVNDAVAIATSVSAALDYAHDQGVVHRDIKPENILLQRGVALVADFGIAVAVHRAAGKRLTETGLSLGTPHYMSPEQAAGDRNLDGRSDVYSLGCVVYEMLAGDPPFAGSTAQAIIARHLADSPPPVRTVRRDLDPSVDTAITRALHKVPSERFATTEAFTAALTSAGPGSIPKRRWRKGHMVALAAVGAAAMIAGTILLLPRGDLTPPLAGRLVPITTSVTNELNPTWSPDGRSVAFGRVAKGDMDVFVMTVGGEARQITDHPADDVGPRWSPLGDKIAFTSDRGEGTNVYWVAPTGGRERLLARTGIPMLERSTAWFRGLGQSPWSPDGRRLLFPRLGSSGEFGIWMVDVETGVESQLTNPGAGGIDMGASWSPAGDEIVFDRTTDGPAGLWTVAAAGGEPQPLLDDGNQNFGADWLPDGRRILFASSRIGALAVTQMDVRSGRVAPSGTPFPLVYHIAVSSLGDVAYAVATHRTDLFLGRVGQSSDDHLNLTTSEADHFGAHVNAAGSLVVFHSTRNGPYDVWARNLETGEERPLTDDPSMDVIPSWSPDGAVVFASDRGGELRLWVLDTGAARPRLLSNRPFFLRSETVTVYSRGPRWSPDGSVIGFIGPRDSVEALWIIAPDGADEHAADMINVRGFDWYLDGRRVVYTVPAGDGQSGNEVRVANLATGEDRLLLTGDYGEPTVSPTGTELSLLSTVSHYSMDAFLVRLRAPTDAGGLPEVAGGPERLTDGGGIWHTHNLSWLPDGQSFVYTRDEDHGDIWMLRREQ